MPYLESFTIADHSRRQLAVLALELAAQCRLVVQLADLALSKDSAEATGTAQKLRVTASELAVRAPESRKLPQDRRIVSVGLDRTQVVVLQHTVTEQT